jgi:F-type H+-transporting ATPase subunit a
MAAGCRQRGGAVEAIEHPAIFMIPNFLGPLLPGAFIPDHVAMAWVVIALLTGLSVLCTRRLRSVPGPLQNALEVTVEAFHGLIDSIIGQHGRKYLPLLGAVGLFILAANLLGLVPGFKSPTANINTTAALALAVFVAYHVFGVREQGALTYAKHFLGPVGALPKALLIFMGPVLVPVFILVEVIGHCARVLSLSIRLFGNIFGEDAVILFLFFLAPLIAPLPMMGLAIFTSVVQALVFVMLSTIYIAGAVEHAHEEH